MQGGGTILGLCIMIMYVRLKQMLCSRSNLISYQRDFTDISGVTPLANRVCNGVCTMLRSKPGQECLFLLALQLIQCDLMLPLLRLLFLKTQ